MKRSETTFLRETDTCDAEMTEMVQTMRFSERTFYRGQSPSGHLVDDQQPAILKIGPFLWQSALHSLSEISTSL